jgi:hypothetical protein
VALGGRIAVAGVVGREATGSSTNWRSGSFGLRCTGIRRKAWPVPRGSDVPPHGLQVGEWC